MAAPPVRFKQDLCRIPGAQLRSFLSKSRRQFAAATSGQLTFCFVPGVVAMRSFEPGDYGSICGQFHRRDARPIAVDTNLGFPRDRSPTMNKSGRKRFSRLGSALSSRMAVTPGGKVLNAANFFGCRASSASQSATLSASAAGGACSANATEMTSQNSARIEWTEYFIIAPFVLSACVESLALAPKRRVKRA